jgi:uncharacterized protein (TIGR02452 family)
MNRNHRIRLAEQTLELLERGNYQNRMGATVDLKTLMQPALAGTTFHEAPLTTPVAERGTVSTAIEVTAESTVEAIVRLHRTGAGHLAAMNFASAKNPGGGFLGGAQAQEESLARSSGLYPCLLRQPQFYERHRNSRCLLYQHLAIFSPGVPFFVDDNGELLDEPALASVITSPAPNAGALANNEPAKLPMVPETLRRRAEFVLQLAATMKVDTLILGAWGCGVFRNDPAVVADAFAELLGSRGSFVASFSRVVFAIYDRTPRQDVFKAFNGLFAGHAKP